MSGTNKKKVARGQRSQKSRGRGGGRRVTRSSGNRANAPTQAGSLRGSPSTEMRLALPLFPANFRRRLHYYDTGLSITSGTGTAGTYFYQANGLYDPDITGTGHQPMGFDQVMLFFTTYTVVASEILVTAYSTGSGLCRTAVFLKESATAALDPTITLESGLASTKIHYPGNTGQFGSIRSHTMKCDVKNYFARGGSRRNLASDDLLRGSATTNPAEGVYFGISVWDPRLVAVAGVYFDVYIVFDVMFSEPRRGTLSSILDLIKSGTAENLGPDSEVKSGKIWKAPLDPSRRDLRVLQDILNPAPKETSATSVEAETVENETGVLSPGGTVFDDTWACSHGAHDEWCDVRDHAKLVSTTHGVQFIEPTTVDKVHPKRGERLRPPLLHFNMTNFRKEDEVPENKGQQGKSSHQS